MAREITLGIKLVLDNFTPHSTAFWVGYYNSQTIPFKKRGLSHDVQLLAELAHVKHDAMHTPHSILPLTLK